MPKAKPADDNHPAREIIATRPAKEIAQKVGTSYSSVYYLKSGERGLTRGMAKRIAQAYGLEPAPASAPTPATASPVPGAAPNLMDAIREVVRDELARAGFARAHFAPTCVGDGVYYCPTPNTTFEEMSELGAALRGMVE